MTVVSETEDIPAVAMLEVSVRDSAVVALGADERGVDALAVWQFSARGVPTGAWAVSQGEAFGSAKVARQLLSILERRAISAHEPSDVHWIVERLSTTAGIDMPRWWDRQVFCPLRGFREVLERRESFVATVAATRQSGRDVSDLVWKHDYSASPPPDDLAALQRLTGRVVPPGAPAVSEVLTVCAVLRWLIDLWNETEQIKNRRSYVSAAHGAPEALPPSWLSAVHCANETRLPL